MQKTFHEMMEQDVVKRTVEAEIRRNVLFESEGSRRLQNMKTSTVIALSCWAAALAILGSSIEGKWSRVLVLVITLFLGSSWPLH